MDHEWPVDPEEHVFGKWMALAGPPESKFTQYRVCVHPGCNVYQDRPAPM